MIALMEHECVEKKKWITHDDLVNMTVIAESTPGPIAVNCATYIGYQQAGFIGSVLTTICAVLPSFIIIYLISLFFGNILEIEIIANIFRGIKIAVGVLMLSVAFKMFVKTKKKPFPLAVTGCSFAVMFLINLLGIGFSGIYIILISGLAGYLAFAVGVVRNRMRGSEK
jgi:chromate transporter